MTPPAFTPTERAATLEERERGPLDIRTKHTAVGQLGKRGSVLLFVLRVPSYAVCAECFAYDRASRAQHPKAKEAQAQP